MSYVLIHNIRYDPVDTRLSGNILGSLGNDICDRIPPTNTYRVVHTSTGKFRHRMIRFPAKGSPVDILVLAMNCGLGSP